MKAKTLGRSVRGGLYPLLAFVLLAALLMFPAVALADDSISIDPSLTDEAVVIPDGTPQAMSSISRGPDLGGAEDIGSAISAEIGLSLTDEAVVIPDGTPQAMSSISRGPDLGGAEDIGSAISAEIGLTVVADAPVVAAANTSSASTPVGEDPPVSIPQGTPTTMSSTSTVPNYDEPVLLTPAPSRTAVKAISAAPTPVAEAVPATLKAAVSVSSTTTVVIPGAIDAGGGGMAAQSHNQALWALMVVAIVLVAGLVASSRSIRGAIRN